MSDIIVAAIINAVGLALSKILEKFDAKSMKNMRKNMRSSTWIFPVIICLLMWFYSIFLVVSTYRDTAPLSRESVFAMSISISLVVFWYFEAQRLLAKKI